MTLPGCAPVRTWLALFVLVVISIPAQSAQRAALVIGNASYAHAPALANPLNDAADVGAALERLDFSVTRLDNVDYAELRRGLLEFTREASASEVAVVFYAGHGIEVDGRNFLVPVDARLATDETVEFESVPLDLVQQAVRGASGLRLVILDACRENPFAMSMQRAGATRSIGRGLARIEPSGDTLVAYAAREGTVASDGQGRNSPYSEALLAYLEEPGLELGLMFRKVRDAVLAASGGRQEPFVYGSLSSRGVYLAAAPGRTEPALSQRVTTADQSVSARVEAERELLFWESIRDSEHPAAIQLYLDRYPGGTFAALARLRLEHLEDAATSPTQQQSTVTLQVLRARVPPGQPYVRGLFKGADGRRYEGGYGGNSEASGGTITWAEGDRYAGRFSRGEMHGHGTYTWAAGGRYEGKFAAGNVHGRGTYTSPDGRAMTCDWRDNTNVSGTCEFH